MCIHGTGHTRSTIVAIVSSVILDTRECRELQPILLRETLVPMIHFAVRTPPTQLLVAFCMYLCIACRASVIGEVVGNASLSEDAAVTVVHEIADLPVSALDTTVLEELRGTFGGRTELVANLYANFLVHAAQYIAVLRDAQDEARTTTLHTLKGSAAMLGAVRIAALAAQLHEASLRKAERPLEPAIRQLEDELAMFRQALARHLPK
jgi:HPt (histidine-containing phosphotransfer) domain-containing protein